MLVALCDLCGNKSAYVMVTQPTGVIDPPQQQIHMCEACYRRFRITFCEHFKKEIEEGFRVANINCNFSKSFDRWQGIKVENENKTDQEHLGELPTTQEADPTI